eukprot:GHVR01190639.1.p2 GENE.GHVR01190639.1~~GHVR01190639.1.p2  ORF type:complete len:119 (-),score=22.86 GHVR01190639.1:262-618(-)
MKIYSKVLIKLLCGHPDYKIKSGNIYLHGEDISDMEPHERSHKGLFVAFQQPPEINGLNNLDFIRAAVNSKKKSKKEPEIDPLSFNKEYIKNAALVGLDSVDIGRDLNVDFSGGEKKK